MDLSANIKKEFIANAHKEYNAKNYKAAIDLYNRGCYMGFDDACISIGNMYLTGDGVEKNLKKANRYIKISCKRGNTESCNILEQEKQRKKDVIKAKLQEADFFMRKNIPLNTANKWKQAGFTPKETNYYISNNIPLNEARQLIQN